MCILRCQQDVRGCWNVSSSGAGLNSIYFAETFGLMSRCWKRKFWRTRPSQSYPFGTDCKPVTCHLLGREMSRWLGCWFQTRSLSCGSAGVVRNGRRACRGARGSSCVFLAAPAVLQSSPNEGCLPILVKGGGIPCKN